MENEMLEILRALKSGQDYLIAKIDQIDLRLARVEGEVKAIREKQEEQDKVVDILSARTTRLQAKIEAEN